MEESTTIAHEDGEELRVFVLRVHDTHPLELEGRKTVDRRTHALADLGEGIGESVARASHAHAHHVAGLEAVVVRGHLGRDLELAFDLARVRGIELARVLVLPHRAPLDVPRAEVREVVGLVDGSERDREAASHEVELGVVVFQLVARVLVVLVHDHLGGTRFAVLGLLDTVSDADATHLGTYVLSPSALGFVARKATAQTSMELPLVSMKVVTRLRRFG